jgi:para-nitrobenzyl esterase
VDVRTVSGVVRGRWEGPVAVFRGIPYAKPPFGPRRFRAPVPVPRWDGVRDALEFGPPMPQPSAPYSLGELTLDVWSPLGGGLPVMVWIHGGAYVEGGSSNPHCDARQLAAGGVVVVTVNYRVGVEGFAHIDGRPANRGLLDQVAALRWVRDHISAFGGDPDTVTVFGQSAGAGSVAALLAMPSARGLCHRAIVQSLPGTYFTPRLAGAVTAAVAAEVGTTDLETVPPRLLVAATETIRRTMAHRVRTWGPMATTPTPFSPVVDGDVLPSTPWRALAEGAARDVDLLVGHTRDEYRLIAAHATDRDATAALDLLAPDPDAYRRAFPQAELYELVNADWLMRMPTIHLADAHQGRTWTYELRWSYNTDEGASHSLDVLLVFGTLAADEVRRHPSARPGAADEVDQVAERMRTDWLTFATTGTPGWSPQDTRVYDTVTQDGPYPEQISRRIWRDHRFDALDLIGPAGSAR